jgi:hypothetical protein
VGFCLGILPVNILYLISLTPSIILPYPFSLLCIVQQFSVHFVEQRYSPEYLALTLLSYLGSNKLVDVSPAFSALSLILPLAEKNKLFSRNNSK